MKETIVFNFYKIINLIGKIFIKAPIVKSEVEAVNNIKLKNASLCRFGDGELLIMRGKSIKFQEHNSLLEKKLKEILRSNQENLLVCIPDIFESLDQYRAEEIKFWTSHLVRNRTIWNKLLDIQKIYYNAFLSRPYMMYKNKNESEMKFNILKSIWNGRDVLIIEGEKSLLGIGNDLFDCCKSIQRVICPNINAFEKYDEILKVVKQNGRSKLILIALGPTATVLAYDLIKSGYQALDIGHIDIEYEWFLKGSQNKDKIFGKFTNEVNGGDLVESLENELYKNQIICRV